MIYIKAIHTRRLEDALAIADERAQEIRELIGAAYQQSWRNVDEINAFVAPRLNNAEEAFYACSVILTDIYGPHVKFKK